MRKQVREVSSIEGGCMGIFGLSAAARVEA